MSHTKGRHGAPGAPSSAIMHPSTAGRKPVGDRMGSGASGTPAGDRRGNERAKKRGQHVIRRITARSIAHPLRSATPLTGALKANKIGTHPKSPSTSGILARCSSVVCNAQTPKSKPSGSDYGGESPLTPNYGGEGCPAVRFMARNPRQTLGWRRSDAIIRWYRVRSTPSQRLAEPYGGNMPLRIERSSRM